ncbi:MAG: hypothetical protein LBU65_00775 [Planctomycetaceae bacterium]|nr:hypothetical protein [Planctomycetaceae bacterium]
MVVSPVLLRELTEAPDNKRDFIFDFLDRIPHIEIPVKQDASDLAKLYVQENVLSEKHKDDLEHVAYAVVSHCDYIVSWNMKHIVKERTMSRVNAVNLLNRYLVVSFVTPQFFTGDTSDVRD